MRAANKCYHEMKMIDFQSEVLVNFIWSQNHQEKFLVWKKYIYIDQNYVFIITGLI